MFSTRYGDFRALPRIRASHKVLCDKAYDIVKNQKFNRY